MRTFQSDEFARVRLPLLAETLEKAIEPDDVRIEYGTTTMVMTRLTRHPGVLQCSSMFSDLKIRILRGAFGERRKSSWIPVNYELATFLRGN